MKRATALQARSILAAALLLAGLPAAWAQTDTPAAQGGAAPPDARDPHAWSGGHTLGTGQYAVADTRQLRLGDEHRRGSLRVERLERVHTEDGVSTTYDLQAWYGRDYDRLALKAEGDYAEGTLHEARTELLWSHAVAGYWDAQLGLRHDSGTGPARTWLAVGIQGLAPYWFEVDATAYVDGDGRTALRLAADYELLLTQRLVLQPRAEVAFHGKGDAARGLGSGLTDAVIGLRLRYEPSRRLAPYLGVEWAGKYGETADLARANGESTGETRWMVGLRFWF
ncbi:MAG: copper resistance protein CopB [Gammaproteobacteria bacterium HGW-Gammaproteobacteria-1]|jgi:copper resistance protein B|nr:MAG: copper resistance protein CopB [Gammaproteobacteria bacterium HGW-Gammaproteobacteria-1]